MFGVVVLGFLGVSTFSCKASSFQEPFETEKQTAACNKPQTSAVGAMLLRLLVARCGERGTVRLMRTRLGAAACGAEVAVFNVFGFQQFWRPSSA
jgi:hypothetical protein